MSGEAGLPPGWYPHAQAPETLRYWDGSQWTDSYAPMQRPAPPRDDLPTWVSVVGYVGMILFPILGFVIGLLHMAKSQIGEGVAMVVVSIVAGVVWLDMLSTSASTYY